MSASVSVVLPAPLRRRTESFGLCAGLLCFLFSFFGNSLGALFPPGPPAVVLPMVLFSAVAGAGAALLANVSPECPAGAAPRFGIRATMFAAITGGALTVFAATLHAFGIGSSPANASTLTLLSNFFPKAGASLNLFLVLLGIPASIFFGIAGSLIATMLCARFANTQPSIVKGRRRLRFRDPIFSAMLALSAIGYLSPFAVALRPRPSPERIAVAPITPVAPVAPRLPPPKWRYRKPAEFDSADASQVAVSDSRTFEIDGSLPLSLSRDETRLAYFRRTPNTTLEIRDLDTLDVLQSFPLRGTPSALSWSPDGTGILVVCQAETKSVQIFNSTGRVWVLPQPVNDRIPEGPPNWWTDDEVLFGRDETLTCLSLDTLRVYPASESAKWNTLPKEKQARVASYQNRPALPGNFRWTLDIWPRIRSYEINQNLDAPWKTNRWFHLALSDPDNAYRATLPQVEINIGDVVLATSDSTKLLHIRNGVASVFYLGLRPQSSTALTISMPAAPDASLIQALADKSVCAFICAPLINPLNGKIVGPNRGQVKALARIAKWKDDKAEAWITEEYAPVHPGDVIGDIHVWDNHQPQAIHETAAKEWFAVIDQFDRKAPPAKNNAPPLDRQFTVSVLRNNGSERVDRIVNTSLSRSAPVASAIPASTNASPPASPGAAQIPPPFISAPHIPSPPQQAPAPQFATFNPRVAQLLANFIYEHHAKSSRGDVAGLVADYADSVNHFDHGIVDREFIRKDETEYHSPGTRVTETLIAPPAFTTLGSNLYSASYSLSFLRIRPDRHWTKGVSEIQMQISLTPAGPRITSQQSQTHDLKKGR